jgi:hypothetical protein
MLDFLSLLSVLLSDFTSLCMHTDSANPALESGHSLSRYDGLETRKTSKPQTRRPLFDVELYLTVHKSFVSTSLNITHRGCPFHLSYPYWTITFLYKNTMS